MEAVAVTGMPNWDGNIGERGISGVMSPYAIIRARRLK